LDWISAFLSNRQQRVCINGNYSSWGKVTSGIPQGSVLGPILFVIYINDLPDVVRNSFAYLFADDTKVFKVIACDEDRRELQSDLSALQEWSDTWLLKFHPDKCEVLTIGKDEQPAYPYYLESGGNRHPLNHVEYEKDLGITVSTNLDFDQHISEKVNKGNSMMGLIRRTFQYIDEENFKLLYKAFVRPHLEYGNAVWSPHKVEHITALENVQRRATKLVPAIKDLPYEERLKRLCLPTLAYRRLRGDMIETYKMFNSYDPDVALDLQRRVSNTRGHKYKLCMRRSNRDIGKYSFSSRIVQPWNSLYDITVCSPNLKIFEARLDRQWKSEALYFDYRASPPGACKKKEPTLEV
jgi:ribonuclease P/MRP protein subunit RPP40